MQKQWNGLKVSKYIVRAKGHALPLALACFSLRDNVYWQRSPEKERSHSHYCKPVILAKVSCWRMSFRSIGEFFRYGSRISELRYEGFTFKCRTFWGDVLQTWLSTDKKVAAATTSAASAPEVGRKGKGWRRRQSFCQLHRWCGFSCGRQRRTGGTNEEENKEVEVAKSRWHKTAWYVRMGKPKHSGQRRGAENNGNKRENIVKYIADS